VSNFYLTGYRLLAGLYLNELLLKLLRPYGFHDVYDSHENIYLLYFQTLNLLGGLDSFSRNNLNNVGMINNLKLESALRCFEIGLLANLGYGLNLKTDALSGNVIQSDNYYLFDPQQGFFEYRGKLTGAVNSAVIGSSILQLGLFSESNDCLDITVLRDAKRILRCAIDFQLGNKILYTRKMVPVF
jgi:DNA repair protein RecO (recombination protein O)